MKKARSQAKAAKRDVKAAAVEAKLDQLVESSVLDTVSVTGVLASQYLAEDVKIDQFNVSLHGRVLVKDATLELNAKRRYGLIGQNGSGKSTILSIIAARAVPIPDHIDIWHLHTEAQPSESTAVDSVIDVVRDELEATEAAISQLMEDDPENEEMMAKLCEKLDKMDPDTFEKRACELLHGLGFTVQMMHKQTKDMSGGWRMRVALAQALFVQPKLLLMDEPTNHLDLEACVWLENYLATYENSLVVISHSQDFLNGVCTNIMHLIDGVFQYYGGNYDIFVRTREENAINQMKRYTKEQDDIKHLKDFIASCGTYSNLVKQAQSKQKIIDKMEAAGLTPKPAVDPVYSFSFPAPDSIPPPVMSFDNVCFSYSGKKEDYLYKKVEFGVDMDSRIALVGPNGAGKSTLLKLMCGELSATEGTISRNGHLRIGRYNQHSTDQLDLRVTPLEFVAKLYPEGISTRHEGTKVMDDQQWRGILGAFGVSGGMQTQVMGTMSHGMLSRVVFCLISLGNPHILLLDEPTNHLDMGCIDSLAGAINKFPGGLVLVSHDFRLISQVAKEIWICDNGIKVWKGDIVSYKKQLLKASKAEHGKK